jgi:N-acetylneuraminate synthase
MIKKMVRDRKKTYIIAEIGGNFLNFEQAKELIDAAYDCGVDAVKIQTYKADTLSSKNAIFDMENTGITSQYELFKKYEIDEELHKEIFKYIDSKGLDWFSTPSHKNDVDMLDKLGVKLHKIGSDDANNLPFLKYVAKTGKPIMLSTGMCNMEEVKKSVSAIIEEGNEQITLLHAITSYPTHPKNVNLLAMKAMMEEFDLPVGYSDHTIGTVACVAAVAMGAVVIEKHFTTDKLADGPDHQLSANPAEMKSIVEQVRTLEKMLGSGIKMPAESEEITRKNNRKSIVAIKNINKGEILTELNTGIKRPGHGIQPEHYNSVLGKTSKKDIMEDELLSWDVIN